MTVVAGVDGSPPSRTALRLAAQEARCRQTHAQLIVLAASPGKPMLPGTVSQYVLHKAECPVMLVPSGGPASQPADQPKGEAPR